MAPYSTNFCFVPTLTFLPGRTRRSRPPGAGWPPSASSSGAAPPSRVVPERAPPTPSDDGMEVDDYEDVDAAPPDTREPDASLASDDDDYDDGYEN